MDPLIAEEEMSESLIRIAVDSSVVSDKTDEDSIYFLEVSGSKEIDPAVLEKCYHKALSRARFIRKIIDKHTTGTTSNREVEIKYEPMEQDS